MKDSKGKPVSEKKIEASFRRWEKRLKPLSEAIARSECLTAADYAVTITRHDR